jgi:EF hand
MKHLKYLPVAIAAYGIFAMAAWGQVPLQSTAPEPATAPSQAVTVPQPSTSPSSEVGPAATVTYTFDMLDTNRDNSISREEAARLPELANIFEQLDRNHDGKLDRSEYVNISK